MYSLRKFREGPVRATEATCGTEAYGRRRAMCRPLLCTLPQIDENECEEKFRGDRIMPAYLSRHFSASNFFTLAT